MTVFIHKDAVVYGSILAVNVKNVKILGEGVLDGSFYERKTESFLLGYDFARSPDASWEKQQMKNIVDGSASTTVKLLEFESRVDELSRIIDGRNAGELSKKHAQEMLRQTK